MNRLGYDAMALGSGDFVIGWDMLQKRMTEAAFPMLSANVVLSETGALVGQPYIVKELTAEHKAAIIGLTDPDVVGFVRAIAGPPLRVLDAAETLRRYVDELSPQADVIILLSHLGFGEDQNLARQFPEIDIIVGGKSGHLFNPPIRPVPDGPIIAQAGSLGQNLGLVRLDFDARGNLLSWDGRLILLGPDSPDDPAMVEFLQPYRERLTPIAPNVETQ